MIISTLNKVINEANVSRRKRGLKPINSDNGLSKKMKQAGLYVSRPTIAKLRNNNPKNPIRSIDFQTLDRLCQFFNRSRIQDFFRYVGSWTYVQIQDFASFNKENNIANYGLDINKVPRGCTIVKVTDSHKHGWTSTQWNAGALNHAKDNFTHFTTPKKQVKYHNFISGKQDYLLIFIPRFVQTGIHKSHNSYTIQCAYFTCLTSKHKLYQVQESLVDIFNHFDTRERTLLDSMFIHNFSKTKKLDGKTPIDKSPLWRSMENVPVQDGFGTIYIDSDKIEAPKFSYALSSDINDSSYNFKFYDKISDKIK